MKKLKPEGFIFTDDKKDKRWKRIAKKRKGESTFNFFKRISKKLKEPSKPTESE